MLVNQCVRLGMAIIIIVLISLLLYQFSTRTQAAESLPAAHPAATAG